MKKGFTLIELLAVIVILAIIALIATPIILNIIEDSRNSANQRSVELYKSAIVNAVAKSQMTSNPIQPGDLSSEFLQTIEYSGATVSCTTNILYSDGSIYLAGCTVGNDTKEYSYGTRKYTQVYNPQYYIWQSIYDAPDDLGRYIPETNSEVPPEGKTIYFGYNLYTYTWDQITYYPGISSTYACFKRNGNEYCLLSGGLEEEYAIDSDVIRDAFSDVADDPSHCTFNDDGTKWTSCSDGGITAYADEYGYATVSDDTYDCTGDEFGYGNCRLKN